MKTALLEIVHRLKVVDKPLRHLNSGEVLIGVSACGLCGTDVHIVDGTARSTPPVVLGHEFTGIVRETCDRTTPFAVGDHVGVDPNISCGTCFYCRRGEVNLCENLRALGVDIDGGMAEFCIVPSSQLFRIPTSMTSETAVFIEPLSCAVHGIDRAGIRPGDTVVVMGGGTVGLLMLQLIKIAGAARVILVEPVEWRRAIASRIGADVVLDPTSVDVLESVYDLSHPGADAVVECTGLPDVVSFAFSLVRRGGTVEIFGVCPVGRTIPVEPNEVYFRELTIVGSYVNPHTYGRAIKLLEEGKVSVDQFTVQKYPLQAAHDALRALREGAAVKSMIVPGP